MSSTSICFLVVWMKVRNGCREAADPWNRWGLPSSGRSVGKKVSIGAVVVLGIV